MIVICACSVHFDKFITLYFENNLGFRSPQSATWAVFQNLGILLIWFFIPLKPFKVSYLVPIYIFTIQNYWVYNPSIQFDDYLLQTVAIGACVLFLFITYIISKAKILHDQRALEAQQFIKEQRESLELLRQNIINSGA